MRKLRKGGVESPPEDLAKFSLHLKDNDHLQSYRFPNNNWEVPSFKKQ